MLVSPLDYRYGRDVMKAIFAEEGRLQRMLDVEAALAQAHASLGNIPQKAADEIRANATVDEVKLERIKEIEAEIGHDLMALVKALAEKSGPSGGYVHYGATSQDVIDTATALQLKEAIRILDDDLRRVRSAFLEQATRHRHTVMLGRTHGQAAVPMTFGLKMAVYAAEVNRHMERLQEVRPRILVGKMTGAVGNGAALGENALEVQRKLMNALGLDAEEAATQVVGRDRYVEFVSLMANIAASCEKFATEVRNLQRTEIGEVQEPFDIERQVGSSTMAHKVNPVTSENICGLSRIVRAFVVPTLENVPLWHERDLTNSAAERFTIPHVCILVDDMLDKTARVFARLVVNEKRMLENLEATKGLTMSEAVMMALASKGMSRQDAHELTRRASREATKANAHLREVLAKDPKVKKYLGPAELDEAFDYRRYLGANDEIIEAVVRRSGGL